MKSRHNHNSRPRFGIFNSWFYGDYLFEFVSGIEYEAERHDVDVIYFTGRSLHSPYPYEENHNIVFDIAPDASLDGLVIMSGIIDYCTRDRINEFVSRFSSLPLVTVDFKQLSGTRYLRIMPPDFACCCSILLKIMDTGSSHLSMGRKQISMRRSGQKFINRCFNHMIYLVINLLS